MDNTKLIVIIQCEIAKRRCSGFYCMDSFYKKDRAFSIYPKEQDIQYMMFECGGCCGKEISSLLGHLSRKLKEEDIIKKDEVVIHLASCMVEALFIDRNVSFTDLKQALLLFAQEMFGKDTKIRLRPSYFPFTEPSAEMDISCNICGGKGCPFCKGTGWVEILGCGMVDPNVLELNGIDSKIYSGYALGMGIERIANLKYRVNDLRLFSENDTRFLKEFEAAY